MNKDDAVLSPDRPFPGLRPFSYGDHPYFFGRQDQTAALYLMLDYSRFIAVVGNSGSGKSSLVRAGLLPLLDSERAGAVGPGGTGRQWRWATMQPGDSPLGHLADALTQISAADDDPDEVLIKTARRERILFTLRRSSFGLVEALADQKGMQGQSFLILVDQFEEIFRYSRGIGDRRVDDTRWRDEAVQFVQLLLAASRSRDCGVHILITMRSDFIGDCSLFYGLPEAVSASQYLVPSLTRDQREDAIAGPLDKAGGSIEPVLMERLLNDNSTEPDGLPVLQHCLSRLWAHTRQLHGAGTKTLLSTSGYAAVGGVAGALSQHAEEVMASLPGMQGTVEQVFRALSEVDDEGRATRRVLRFERLLAETGAAEADLRLVLDRFRSEDCSFLVPSVTAVPQLRADTRVDVGHESLLRRWERISAKPNESVGTSGGGGGWLAAELKDAATYRALLALLDNAAPDQKTTLPLDQVKSRVSWWQSRPRTAAWAERYGGHVERVVGLFADSIAAQKRHASRQIAIWSSFCVLVLIAGGAFAWSYAQFVEAENRATLERAMLLQEMTNMATDISTNLRVIPWTGVAIQEMLAQVNTFSEGYKQWLAASNLTSRSGMALRLSATASRLESDLEMNRGNITGAAAMLDQTLSSVTALEQELQDRSAGTTAWLRRNVGRFLPQPTQTRTDWIPIMRADILARRSIARRMSADFAGAALDLATAEETLISFIASSRGDAADEGKLTVDLIEKARQKLAALYASRIDLELHYRRVDAAAAELDYGRLDKLVAASVPAGSGNAADNTGCQRLLAKFWCNERQYHLPLLWGDVEAGKNDYEVAIQTYQIMVDRYTELKQKQPENALADLRLNYYLFRLGQVLAQRGQGSDVQEAARKIRMAADYYGTLEERDSNAWWSVVHARIERALGMIDGQANDLAAAQAALEEAEKDDQRLLTLDPANKSFQEDYNADKEQLAAVISRQPPLAHLGLHRAGAH